MPYYFCRISHCYTVGWDVACDNGICSNNASFPNCDIGKYGNFLPNPDIFADPDSTFGIERSFYWWDSYVIQSRLPMRMVTYIDKRSH